MEVDNRQVFSTIIGGQIARATQAALESEDWAANLEICDLVKASSTGPGHALNAIQANLTSPSPRIVLLTLSVLQTCMANCGPTFHRFVASRPFIEIVAALATKEDSVGLRTRFMLQTWIETFSGAPQHYADLFNAVADLRRKGVVFPVVDLSQLAPIVLKEKAEDTQETLSLAESQPQPTWAQSNTIRKTVSDQGLPGEGWPTRHTGTSDWPNSTWTGRHSSEPAVLGQVVPTAVQELKLRRDLAIVQATVSALMRRLAALGSEERVDANAQLMALINSSKSMQQRIVALLQQIDHEQLTAELLAINDRLQLCFASVADRQEEERANDMLSRGASSGALELLADSPAIIESPKPMRDRS